MKKELKHSRRKPHMGRPPELTEEKVKHILKFVPESYVMSQVARLSGTPQQRLHEWLKKGTEDVNAGIDSIYAHLAVNYEQLKGKDIKSLISKMLAKGAWQACHEILKASAPEDFGKDAELYKELFADFEKLVQSMKLKQSQPLQGNVSDGREMDSKGD